MMAPNSSLSPLHIMLPHMSVEEKHMSLPIESKLNLSLALTNRRLWKQYWLVPGLSLQKAWQLLLLCLLGP